MMTTNHEPNRGGDIFLISPQWKYKVIHWGSDPSNQVVWIFLKLKGMYFGIINIYVSNDPHDQSLIWRWFMLSLLPTMWVMCANMNMVKKGSDKIEGNPNRSAGREREVWYFMKNKLRLSNPNSYFTNLDIPNSLWYTWSKS